MSTEDSKLLAAILDACEIKLGKPEHDKIAALIGGNVTGNAIRQRIAKIRKNGAAILAAETVGATTTPGKDNGVSAKKKGRGGSNKRGKVEEEEDGEDDEAPESPSKKVKVEVGEPGSFFDEGGVEGEDAV